MSATSMTQLVLPVSDRDHMLGPANAPVTLVEYGDYQCPYCAAAHGIVKDIVGLEGDQLRFVFRHFPLTQIHPQAETAAEAAEAAGAQGRFWEMHDLLFQNQQTLDQLHLARFAQQLGLNVPKFVRELQAHAYHERVREDFLTGVRSGVNGTPTFFINGVRHEGSWQLTPLLAAIERARKAAA